MYGISAVFGSITLYRPMLSTYTPAYRSTNQ